MEVSTLSVTLSIIASVLAIIGLLTGFFGWLWRKLLSLLRGQQDLSLRVPRKTVTLLPKPGGKPCWWHMGALAGKPAMQISGEFAVTNRTKIGILPTVAKMRKPRCLGHVSVREVTSKMYGAYVIPPAGTTDLVVDFWIQPPVRKEGESFVGDLAIVDQFGNEHWLRKVEFLYC